MKTVCQTWLRLEAQLSCLQLRWAHLERQLIRHHRWFHLSPEEQKSLPAATELNELDPRIDTLRSSQSNLLEMILLLHGATLSDVINKLAVVEKLVLVEDNPAAHHLISSCLEDLSAFSA